MTFFVLLGWIVLGGVLGLLAAAVWPVEGLTWARGLGIGAFGAVVGGLIGRILFSPGTLDATLFGVTLLFAGLGAVVTLAIARFQIRNRERPRFT